MRVMPLFPASRFRQTSSVLLPTAQMSPSPVTTTLRAKLLASFRVLTDVVDGILHGADLFGILVGNFDVESLLEGHYQLHGIERIGAQIVHERGIGGHFAFVHAQLLHDDLLHFFVNGCHWSPQSWGSACGRRPVGVNLLAHLDMLLEVLDRVFYSADLLSIFVGDFDVKGFLKGHHEFDLVERVSAQIVYEGGAWRDLALLDAELLHHNLFHFFVYSCHMRSPHDRETVSVIVPGNLCKGRVRAVA